MSNQLNPTADALSKPLVTSAVHSGKRGIEDEQKAPPKKQKRQKKYREPDSPANEMMQAILVQPGALRFMRVKVHRSRLLNASLEQDDPRNAIVERNNAESPLFAVLPAEIRNKIFAYALGGQHIHILTDPYSAENDSPDAADTASSTTRYLPTPRLFPSYVFRKSDRVQACKFYNCVYPLHWRDFCSLTTAEAQRTGGDANQELGAGIQVIRASRKHMTLVPAVCRRIYHETKALPYALNEFSFQDELTMKDWLRNRAAAQKRALAVVWLNLEGGYVDRVFRWNWSLFGPQCGLRRMVVPTTALDRPAAYYCTGIWPWPESIQRKKLEFRKLMLAQMKREEGSLQILFVE